MSRTPAAPAFATYTRTAPAPLAEPHDRMSRECLCRAVPSAASRADSCLQAEPIPAFLAEPIRLSLSRQPASVLSTYFGLRSPTGPPVWHGYRYDLSDSMRSSQPDCLSVSSGYATDQYVLGVPSGHRRPDFVPTGAQVARVRERANYWIEVGVRARASWRATTCDRGEP
ncbi:hypothetical protein E5676_scaffold204G00540 [Cucumis melo var. makuwa]|uniref:Uncharacterized protein n=1 Tax=Cucumis melo var. makuwa TaxID=1194695 RepID=A0A5D3D5Q9_CUCMM|nr:hypothetical protein E5676_scaffold204G00540 [Cucumis melo var. makuwa]